MATFFSLNTPSPSVLLLLLLILTAGDLFLRTNAAALDDICRQTKEPSRCVSIIMASDSRSSTAPVPVLAQITIEMATYTAGQNKIGAHNLFLSEKVPNLKAIYKKCEDLYLAALDALLIAPQYLQQRQYGKLAEVTGTVGGAVGGCVAAFKDNAALERGNEDVGVVAQAISVIARSLH